MISRKKKESHAPWFRYRNKDEHAELVTINAKTTKKRPLYSLKSCVVKASVGRSPTEQKIKGSPTAAFYYGAGNVT